MERQESQFSYDNAAKRMERFLMLGKEQGVESFLVQGSGREIADNTMDLLIWIGYFPNPHDTNSSTICAGSFDGVPISVGLLYSLVSDLIVPEELKKIEIDPQFEESNVLGDPHDMPTSALLFGRSEETGEKIAFLRVTEQLDPKVALKQFQDGLQQNFTSRN